MGHLGTFSAAPATYPNLKYDPINGMQPIGLAGGTPILIVARKNLEATDLKAFVAAVKANPDKFNEAHAGLGSVSWTTCTLLKGQLGVPKLNAVAYRGTGPALNDLVSGQIDFMCDQIVSVAEQVKGRHDQGLRGCIGAALACPARRSHDHRSRPAGVSDRGLERHRRTQGHAEGGGRPPRRRTQQGAQRREHQEAPARPGHRNADPRPSGRRTVSPR